MAKEVNWNKVLYDEFLKLGCFSELQKEVLELHVLKAASITEISLKINKSVSTVNKTIRELKNKYDECQKFSDILPPRNKKSNKQS